MPAAAAPPTMERMNIAVEFAGLSTHLSQAISFAQAAYTFGTSFGTSLSRSLGGLSGHFSGPGLQLPPVHGWIRVARAIGPVKVVTSRLPRRDAPHAG